MMDFVCGRVWIDEILHPENMKRIKQVLGILSKSFLSTGSIKLHLYTRYIQVDCVLYQVNKTLMYPNQSLN